MRFMPDKFVLMMICAIVLAFLFPNIGASEGPLHLGLVTKIGIAGVFFLHGANLAPSKLSEGVMHVKVHALIQATTFLAFPLIGLVIYFGFKAVLPAPLRLGFFFLTALPSTISSAVALTAMAKGNVTLAVFNATLSGLLGLIITPVLISLVTASGMAEFSLLDSIKNIALTLLAPFVLGQVMRPAIARFLEQHKKSVKLVDRGVILLIVFSSFATSTLGGVWSLFGFWEVVATVAIVCILLAIAMWGTIKISRLVGLSLEEEVAAVFCGSTKSLANGAPIAQILFAGSPILGALMLPLLIYHQLQIIACATMARQYEVRINS